MKKRLVTIALAIFFVAGIGNVVFAHGDTQGFNPGNDGHNRWSFEEMVPFMKDMHPDMSEAQMEEMYQYCHGTN
ncbi:hypothetical protein FH966_10810 [Lentibacillus cibarius]|uniref:FAD/FMN-containing dehydrogenase n=1 Tax=Lentibacillus cibarius TaxID=2583219 RepID=A0A549YJS4_9BACI|nr:hypothetical protein [Lentibacillus cibarius]TRM12135.1 hypothetical protein FH966_10810 [Lentibacillus cibarius]